MQGQRTESTVKELNVEEEIKREQKLKDSKVNGEGRKLCRLLKEQGWAIINGDVKEDEEGK